jgi:hypothetical protein
MSTRNIKIIMFLGSEVWRVHRADNLDLSGQCGILNISQPYKPPRPVMGIALLVTDSNTAGLVFTLHSNIPIRIARNYFIRYSLAVVFI